MACFKTLSTARLTLRPPRRGDEDDLFALHSDAAVMRYFSEPCYMNEALGALFTYAFGELDLNRLEADVDPRNAASANCLTRFGFAKEGFLRERWIVGGEVCDSALYGLLRRDWNKSAASKVRLLCFMEPRHDGVEFLLQFIERHVLL